MDNQEYKKLTKKEEIKESDELLARFDELQQMIKDRKAKVVAVKRNPTGDITEYKVVSTEDGEVLFYANRDLLNKMSQDEKSFEERVRNIVEKDLGLKKYVGAIDPLPEEELGKGN